jgi:hypothetical protein
MVLLEHSGARIFRENAEDATPEHIKPIDNLGHDHQVHNPLGDSGGKQGPLRHLFYETLAKRLDGAGRILLVGDGQGASSEVEHFLAEIKKHHHLIAERVVGSEVANITHMTEHDLAAKARKFFETS